MYDTKGRWMVRSSVVIPAEELRELHLEVTGEDSGPAKKLPCDRKKKKLPSYVRRYRRVISGLKNLALSCEDEKSGQDVVDLVAHARIRPMYLELPKLILGELGRARWAAKDYLKGIEFLKRRQAEVWGCCFFGGKGFEQIEKVPDGLKQGELELVSRWRREFGRLRRARVQMASRYEAACERIHLLKLMVKVMAGTAVAR